MISNLLPPLSRMLRCTARLQEAGTDQIYLYMFVYVNIVAQFSGHFGAKTLVAAIRTERPYDVGTASGSAGPKSVKPI